MLVTQLVRFLKAVPSQKHGGGPREYYVDDELIDILRTMLLARVVIDGDREDNLTTAVLEVFQDVAVPLPPGDGMAIYASALGAASYGLRTPKGYYTYQEMEQAQLSDVAYVA